MRNAIIAALLGSSIALAAAAMRLLDAKWGPSGDTSYGFHATATQRADFRNKVREALR